MYSGHGNSEEYRDWRASVKGKNGDLSCPEPSYGYLPCCWRAGDKREPVPYSVPLDDAGVGLVNLRNMERQNSFWLTGGLVAAHGEGRDRGAIWDGLKRKEVYATSGDRILLWFDLIQGEQTWPMGSELASSGNPRFKVSALGAFKQKPGCPDYARNALGEERLQLLYGGECYNPSDERHRIDRIEVVRIRPQITVDEPVGQLIEDPWRSFSCDDDLAEAAGSEGLLSLAQNYLSSDQPVKVLHIVEIVLAGEPDFRAALLMRQQALTLLMGKVNNDTRNDYEIYWLKARLADTEARLETGAG